MTSLHAKYNESTQEELNDEFIKSCSLGDLKLVQYLLTSPKLTRHAQVNATVNLGFRSACACAHSNIVSFLLEFPDFKNADDVDFWHNEGFKLAATNKNYSVLKCFIYDLNITKNHEIIHHLQKNPDAQIETMFNMRDLNQRLNQDLTSHDITNKKPKI